MPSSQDPITIPITITNAPTNTFTLQTSTVAAQGTVNFLGATGSVTTSPPSVFTSGSSPYAVPNSYTLRQGVTQVTMTFNPSPTDHVEKGHVKTGVNGTINVGGPPVDP